MQSELFDKEDILVVHDSKCPTCGADLVFSPADNMLKCEHCGTQKQIQVSMAREKIFDEADFLGVEDWAESKAYKCVNCGAITTLLKGQIATQCPFCGAPRVIEDEGHVGVKPNAVVPFRIDKISAKAHYDKWIKSRLFAPSKLKKNFKVDTMNGVYIPVWTFDANTFSTYYGRLGKRYTTTVGTGKNRRTVTKIRYFSVSGSLSREYDDVTVEAGDRIDQKIYDKIAPYDTNNSVEYDGKYMLGFMAEKYTLDLNEGYHIAQEIMSDDIRSAIISQYDADVVDYIDINTEYSAVTYKYVLLPMWICTYKYGKKVYTFYTNGESGKSYGKTPLSPWRVGLAILLGLAALVGIGYLVYNNYMLDESAVGLLNDIKNMLI
ncbi:MAG: hypothetical protein IKD20_03990 [Clostridia bacterium]|nr:hypothetical protein [Clostridia bacterium]